MAHLHRFASVGALLVSLAACGGGAEPAASPTAPATSGSAAAPAKAAPSAWSKDLSKEEKSAIMKNKVVPTMKPVFQSANATRYAEFGCKTCHGPEYKSPHEFLPKLTMKDGKLTAFAEKPEVAKFMAETVVPKMAGAMGLPPYDMKTQQGFGCGGCHTIETK